MTQCVFCSGRIKEHVQEINGKNILFFGCDACGALTSFRDVHVETHAREKYRLGVRKVRALQEIADEGCALVAISAIDDDSDEDPEPCGVCTACIAANALAI